MQYPVEQRTNEQTLYQWAECIAHRDFGLSARVASLRGSEIRWEDGKYITVETEEMQRLRADGVAFRTTRFPSGRFFLVSMPGKARGEYNPVQVVEVPDWPEASCKVFVDGRQTFEAKGASADKRLAAFLKTMPKAKSPRAAKPKGESVADLKREIARLQAMLANSNAAPVARAA